MISSSTHERHSHGLELHWEEPHKPLPVRLMRGPRRRRPGLNHLDSPPWIGTGPALEPFHFCSHVRRLLEDIVARTPEFSHIHLPRVLVGALQARNGRAHGLQARVTPLRFAHGQLQRRRRETVFQVQRYFSPEWGKQRLRKALFASICMVESVSFLGLRGAGAGDH